MQDVPPVALQPTDDSPAKRFLSAKKSVICDVRMEAFIIFASPLVTVHPENVYPDFATAVMGILVFTLYVPPPVTVPPEVGLAVRVKVRFFSLNLHLNL